MRISSDPRMPVPPPGDGDTMAGKDVIRRIKAVENTTDDNEIACKLGVAPTEIDAWIVGQPDYDRVIEYAREAGISLEYLINGREPAALEALYTPYAREMVAEAYVRILESIGTTAAAMDDAHPPMDIDKISCKLYDHYKANGNLPDKEQVCQAIMQG